jgi:hypothetical protein
MVELDRRCAVGTVHVDGLQLGVGDLLGHRFLRLRVVGSRPSCTRTRGAGVDPMVWEWIAP